MQLKLRRCAVPALAERAAVGAMCVLIVAALGLAFLSVPRGGKEPVEKAAPVAVAAPRVEVVRRRAVDPVMPLRPGDPAAKPGMAESLLAAVFGQAPPEPERPSPLVRSSPPPAPALKPSPVVRAAPPAAPDIVPARPSPPPREGAICRVTTPYLAADSRSFLKYYREEYRSGDAEVIQEMIAAGMMVSIPRDSRGTLGVIADGLAWVRVEQDAGPRSGWARLAALRCE